VRTTLGTDTGGSVRSPAGYCGVVGLKPTFGRVSRQGIYPLSSSLDHVGPISATVAEAALTLDVAAGYDPADPASSSVGSSPAASLLGRDVGGLRVAYARDWFARDPEITRGVLSAMDDAVSQLTLLGIHIEEVSLPDYALFESCGAVILHAEALEVHRESMRARPRDYGRAAFRSLAAGVCLSPADIALAKRAGVQLSETLGGVFSRFEALVTVNTLTTAPPFSAFHRGAAVWTPMRTLPFNLTGHPALVVPAGLSRGLPVSLQIVGQHFDEAQVCRIGDAFEKSTDHSVLRPPEISRVPERKYSETA
jgi:aspartyl-tRNA(Asn)/glutamyl-tRNA(Gln) amidotransferase subunit A